MLHCSRLAAFTETVQPVLLAVYAADGMQQILCGRRNADPALLTCRPVSANIGPPPLPGLFLPVPDPHRPHPGTELLCSQLSQNNQLALHETHVHAVSLSISILACIKHCILCCVITMSISEHAVFFSERPERMTCATQSSEDLLLVLY